jgi:hypothetical protein
VNLSKLIAACAFSIGATVPAVAETSVPLSRFDSVELIGGGEVILRHGPAQKVTLLEGSTDLTDFTVDENGRLSIRACVRTCRDYDLKVEIVTPTLEAAAVRGGGSIETRGEFPAQNSIALAVEGGGGIDLRRVSVEEVAAAVTGGGVIKTQASQQLAAAIHGGGQITYCGNPSITSSVNGGGVITRGCDE